MLLAQAAAQVQAVTEESLSAQFGWIDWSIVVAYLAFTTILGTTLAGKQSTIRDFFLGGRKLPWPAVCGSIIATEISAVTFLIVPSIVFNPGGNFTYLQLGLFGSFIARIIVGYVLVPAYYEKEIYSPYDFMGARLGGQTRGVTTALFALGGVLSQSARVYLTAEVLVVVLNDQLRYLSEATGMLSPLGWAVVVIAIVAITWTLVGGISTVIWTDALLFLVFLIGAVAAFLVIGYELDGGFAELFRVGWRERPTTDWTDWGKFTLFDFSANPTRAYTIWTALIAATWGNLGAYGTDQLIAQRIFCCKNEKEARYAIIASQFSQIVTITVAFVGAGLYAYYQQNPLEGIAAQIYAKEQDRIFPIFIVQAIPVGLKGLIIAGALAAAVSSLTSILAALSQTIMSAFYAPLRERYLQQKLAATDQAEHVVPTAPDEVTAEDRRSVFVGRLFVLFWGIVLAFMAFVAAEVREEYDNILDLALALASYVSGALLAGFALSFLPLRIDGRGYVYAAPLSVMCVFSLVWHDPWANNLCWAFSAILLLIWVWNRMTDAMDTVKIADNSERARRALSIVLRDWPQTIILAAGLVLLLWISYNGYLTTADGRIVKIAWPWYAPIGSTVAFVWGYLLARRRPAESAEHHADASPAS